MGSRVAYLADVLDRLQELYRKNLSPLRKSAVELYGGEGATINRALALQDKIRGPQSAAKFWKLQDEVTDDMEIYGDMNRAVEFPEIIGALDNTILQAPRLDEPADVYRILRGDRRRPIAGHSPGYLSTSAAPEAAFKSGVQSRNRDAERVDRLIKIGIPENDPLLYVHPRIGGFAGEKEVLLPRNKRLRPAGVEKISDDMMDQYLDAPESEDASLHRMLFKYDLLDRAEGGRV